MVTRNSNTSLQIQNSICSSSPQLKDKFYSTNEEIQGNNRKMADEVDEVWLPIITKCVVCGISLQSDDLHCSSCGVALNINTTSIRMYTFDDMNIK